MGSIVYIELADSQSQKIAYYLAVDRIKSSIGKGNKYDAIHQIMITRRHEKARDSELAGEALAKPKKYQKSFTNWIGTEN